MYYYLFNDSLLYFSVNWCSKILKLFFRFQKFVAKLRTILLDCLVIEFNLVDNTVDTYTLAPFLDYRTNRQTDKTGLVICWKRSRRLVVVWFFVGIIIWCIALFVYFYHFRINNIMILKTLVASIIQASQTCRNKIKCIIGRI